MFLLGTSIEDILVVLFSGGILFFSPCHFSFFLFLFILLLFFCLLNLEETTRRWLSHEFLDPSSTLTQKEVRILRHDAAKSDKHLRNYAVKDYMNLRNYQVLSGSQVHRIIGPREKSNFYIFIIWESICFMWKIISGIFIKFLRFEIPWVRKNAFYESVCLLSKSELKSVTYFWLDNQWVFTENHWKITDYPVKMGHWFQFSNNLTDSDLKNV